MNSNHVHIAIATKHHLAMSQWLSIADTKAFPAACESAAFCFVWPVGVPLLRPDKGTASSKKALRLLFERALGKRCWQKQATSRPGKCRCVCVLDIEVILHPQKLTCHRPKSHFKRKGSSEPSAIFSGDLLVFRRVYDLGFQMFCWKL